MSSKSQNLTPANNGSKGRIPNNRSNQLIYLKRQTFNPLFNQILTNRHNQTSDNFCLYLHRFCLQNRLEGYNYCIRHILYDRNAPFKQCSYLHPQTNKRCPNAARRYDRRDRDTSYCPWHIKQFNLQRRKNAYLQNVRNISNSIVNEASKREFLKRKFDDLEHYCPSNEHDHRRKNVDWYLDDKCVMASKALKAKINDSMNLIQCQHQNDEDFSTTVLADVLNLDSLDSDNESVESFMDDPLRHAGIYSAEEIAKTLRDKMLRLQTLYINMLNYYRYNLKNKMRQYYLAKKSKPNEPRSSNETQTALSEMIDPLSEQEDYKKLKAMFKYHNVSGPEKIIKDRASYVRRLLVDDVQEEPQNSPLCVYKKDNEHCRQKCIPLSNYCPTHILYDPYQILYRPCANGSPPCLTPVVSYVHKNSCVRHTQIKFDKTDIDKILKSPIKVEPEPETDNGHLNDLENEPELFHSIEDISLGMDSVEPGNLFNLEQFDLDTNILS